MATETQNQPPVPEITIINRVASIPLVASSINSIHSTLANNTYTRGSYAQAQGISKTALSYTEPIQKTLAPLIVRADGYANKGLDVVESRYPYPFKTPTEDIMKDIKGRGDSAYDFANKTLDEKVKSPALHVAQGIDQRFAPVVDYFQTAVEKIHSTTGTPSEPSTSEPPKYQYQRALSLSKDLSGQVYTYSTEQINQIKAQNVIVQRATDAAQRVSSVASTSYGAAQEKVHTLSDVMLQELHKVQASTSALPATVQNSFHDISTHLQSTITELTNILTSPEPLPDRVHKVRDTVQERVQPLLEASAARVQEILDSLRGKAAEKAEEVQQEAPAPVANGSATNGHA
ncbi:lipid droplet-associated perilipin protein [Cristinia sonorae]|uniref:Lipid droplet-associated perilipin protein n=1 Tax=Cristinia sonorae TaxID=1940300 RepID=A0A8K0UG99_9AGAR|nr:lipid droplet-associated perilipin protein [Cristinia sonorae]